MNIKETHEEYAQRRANETRSKYAVWETESGIKYAAFYCQENRKTYADCGATKQTVFLP